MKRLLKYLFETEQRPKKGLFVVEWVVIGYLLITLLLMLFMYTKVHNPDSMLWGRFRVVTMTLALWAVYRMMPCRLTRLCRIAAQMALLSWWYPDTYELNRLLPNQDHRFAALEQALFGSQPALTFAQDWNHPVFSELMHLGYASYYPMIIVVTLFYFFRRYADFNRTSFVILTSFFLYYLVFIAIPVTGPQYYYLAAGVDNIAHGTFPDMGSYFNLHAESLPIPGWTKGVFYHLVTDAHNAGERPTAAFPSSHVGVTTILLLLAWQTRNRKLVLCLLPLFVLMCFATVYIQAHYAVDVLGGLATGILLFFLLWYGYGKWLAKYEK